jgi:hypothetical protein
LDFSDAELRFYETLFLRGGIQAARTSLEEATISFSGLDQMDNLLQYPQVPHP